MASRKHHKQDATRPTKARARRERTHALGNAYEDIAPEERDTTTTLSTFGPSETQ